MRVVRSAEQDFVPASHEDPQHPGVLKRVIAERHDLLDGQIQMINWARLPVGSSFRSHYHEDMEEAFVLIQGRALMTVDGETAELAVGDAIFIAPLEVHSMRNIGDDEVHYVVIGNSLGQGGKTVVIPAES